MAGHPGGAAACQVFCVSPGDCLPGMTVTDSDRLEGEPVAEADGEGVEGGFPAVGAGAAFAALADQAVAVDVAAGDVAGAEVEQFHRGVVVGEVAADVN